MTYEDVKNIRNNATVESCDIKELHSMIDEAIEKQISKEPIEMKNRYPDGQYECPICGCHVGYPIFKNTPFGEIRSGDYKSKYCVSCGQKIKWGDKQNEID